jgi:hypothetical protein
VNDTIANIEIRVATWNNGGKVKIELDDKLITEADVPVKQAWVTVTVPKVKLEKGDNKILKLSFTGGFDLNWVNFKKVNLSDIESNKGNDFTVYPIPASKSLNINGLPTGDGGVVQLINLDGKILNCISIEKGTSLKSIDVSRVSAGIYILKVIAGMQQFSVKVVIN